MADSLALTATGLAERLTEPFLFGTFDAFGMRGSDAMAQNPPLRAGY